MLKMEFNLFILFFINVNDSVRFGQTKNSSKTFCIVALVTNAANIRKKLQLASDKDNMVQFGIR